MSILTISGSIRKNSTTVSFLEAIVQPFPHFEFERFNLDHIPMFHPDAYDYTVPKEVIDFKEKIKTHDSVIIATPEYIHNIPAVLKNALEWTTQTGEFAGKKILAITYTPNAPRGERAMTSLKFCLNALDANVVATMDLYHDAIVNNKLSVEAKNVITEALDLLH